MNIGELAEQLKKIGSAVIFTHTRPDGDTVGCALALSRALRLSGIRCEVAGEAPLPERYLYLEGAKDITRTPSQNAEAFLCVDVSDPARLGELKDFYLRHARKKRTFNIDHHVSNERFATYNFVRPCSSNCENIAMLLDELHVPIDKSIGECLLAGLVTDSGSFSHDDVTGDTLRLAARCLDAGANIERTNYELMQKKSRARAQFYAEIIAGIRYLLDGKFAVAAIPFGTLERYSLSPDATEGIVDFGRFVEHVEVSACLLENKRGQFQISLRSNGQADVNRVAETFGGGGHVRAAGCMLFGELEEVIDKLRYAVWQNLEDA